MRYSRIIGTGGYLPEKILTNSDLEKMVDTSDEWIVARTGIRERHIAAAHETSCHLAEPAARRALAIAALDPHALALIVLPTPPTASFLAPPACAGPPGFEMPPGSTQVCTGLSTPPY